MPLTLNEMAAESHAIAVQKGWYEEGGPSALEQHMLMVTEVAEATEEVRNGQPPVYVVGKRPEPASALIQHVMLAMRPTAQDIGYQMAVLEEQGWGAEVLKPEGEAVELADVLIRIGDRFAMMGWDLEAVVKLKMNYNRTRPHKHGGKAL